jgi:hypothetical protein
MSYQPIPPPSTPYLAPAPASATKRSKLALWLGLLLIVGGVVAAVALFLGQRGAHETSINNLQRGASGLQTELVFEKDGIFTLYYEYAGSFSAKVDGDEQKFTADAGSEPRRLDVRLLDADENEVRLLRDVPTTRYTDVGGHSGVVYKQVRIRDTGRYTLQVGAKSQDFAIAVGRGVVKAPSPLLPLAIGVGGVVLGGSCLLILGRKRPAAPLSAAAVPGPGWPPAPGAASGAVVSTPGWGASPSAPPEGYGWSVTPPMPSRPSTEPPAPAPPAASPPIPSPPAPPAAGFWPPPPPPPNP